MRPNSGLLLGIVAFANGQLSSLDEGPIPNRYIITLKSDIQEPEVQTHLNWVKDVHSKRKIFRRDITGVEKTYDIGNFHAYAGGFDAETIAVIKNNDGVARVEPDVPIYPWTVTSQKNATWGLGAISHVEAIDQSADLVTGFEYLYDSSNAGEGTFAYVVDSGISVDNADFEGRAEWGYTVFSDLPLEDHSGHGTHVAGTIASKTWGVAKKARVIAVKVLAPDQGVMSTFMDGFQWVVNNITATPGRAAKSVVNMSLGGPVNWSFNNMVAAAADQGILSVVSSGNAAVDASRVSPASTGSAITVGASAANYSAWEWSNYGPVVDLYAPGVDVYSLDLEEGKSVAKSGTSMAAPHVAGLALYLKSTEAGLDSVEAITARILELARKDVIKEVPEGTPNLFAFNGVQSNHSVAELP